MRRIGIGLYRDEREGVEYFVHKEECFEPNPELRDRYDEMHNLYQFIYRTLMDTSAFERLAALQMQGNL